MDNNYSVKILEAYMDIDKIHDSINNKMFQFITKANELVELSENMYQIEKTIKLNKISLKGYILDSPCCSFLKENDISDWYEPRFLDIRETRFLYVKIKLWR